MTNDLSDAALRAMATSDPAAFNALVAEVVCGWQWWTADGNYYRNGDTRFRMLKPPSYKPESEYTEHGIEQYRPRLADGTEKPFSDIARWIPDFINDPAAYLALGGRMEELGLKSEYGLALWRAIDGRNKHSFLWHQEFALAHLDGVSRCIAAVGVVRDNLSPGLNRNFGNPISDSH